MSIDDVARRASVGRGTVYLHWKTSEALFWAVLQRETLRLLQRLIADLAADADLALSPRLIRRIFLELDDRPLVRALLVSDDDVLGGLAADPAVVAAQREMTGMANYLDSASYLLDCVVRGFFTDLLAYALSRSRVADLSRGVIDLFTAITDVQRRQLQDAY